MAGSYLFIYYGVNEMKGAFNCEVEIYQESQPEHYVGSDVGVTITSNKKGAGTAQTIQHLIEGINAGKLKVVMNDK